MQFLRLSLIILVAMIATTACTVEHTFDFNEDMSGSNEFTLDISEAMNMISMMMPNSLKEDAMHDLNMDEDLNKIEEELNNIDGIKNTVISNQMNEGLFSYSFDFDKIETLSKSFDTEGTLSDKDFFVVEKDKMHLNFDAMNTSFQESLGENEMFSTDDMVGFDMGTYKMTFNFPFEIKNSTNTNYQISSDKKSISIEMPLQDLTTKSTQFNTTISW